MENNWNKFHHNELFGGLTVLRFQFTSFRSPLSQILPHPLWQTFLRVKVVSGHVALVSVLCAKGRDEERATESYCYDKNARRREMKWTRRKTRSARREKISIKNNKRQKLLNVVALKWTSIIYENKFSTLAVSANAIRCCMHDANAHHNLPKDS